MGKREWIVLAGAALIAALASHNICDLLFRCGCTFWSIEGCNVHHAMEPHCPWCTDPPIFFGAGATWMAGAYLGARLARARGTLAIIGATALGLILGALLSGALTVAITGYPYFLIRSS